MARIEDVEFWQKISASNLDYYGGKVVDINTMKAVKFEDFIMRKNDIEGYLVYLVEAGLIDTVSKETSFDPEVYQTYFLIKRKLNWKAFTAFSNLSLGDSFENLELNEFASKLVSYARIWQYTIQQLDVFPIEPFISHLDIDRYSYSNEYLASAWANLHPSIVDVLRWSVHDNEFFLLFKEVKYLGIESTIEAFKFGVPLEDLLV